MRAVSAHLEEDRAPPPHAIALGDLLLRSIGVSMHPTGSGALAPTSAHPGTRPQRRGNDVCASHGRWCPRAHINSSRYPLSAKRHMYARPTGSGTPTPTSTAPGTAIIGGGTTYPHTTGSGAPEATSKLPDAGQEIATKEEAAGRMMWRCSGAGGRTSNAQRPGIGGRQRAAALLRRRRSARAR